MYPQSLKLGHSLVLLSRLPKQAPYSIPSTRQLLPQPDDFAQASFHKIRHAQQAKRVTSGSCVEDDPCEACIVFTPDKLHYLTAHAASVSWRLQKYFMVKSHQCCSRIIGAVHYKSTVSGVQQYKTACIAL